jgi:serine/threonine-protein kinase RIO1
MGGGRGGSWSRSGKDLDHPRALHFLARDIRNMNSFFSDKCEMGEREIFQRIENEVFAGP